MKKIVLAALSLAFCASVSAHAFQEPQWGQRYQCFSACNTSNGIFSWAQRTRTGQGSNLIIWGSESLSSQNPYKANWAKPAPVDQNNPNGSTVWEFTLPGVAQCTKVTVHAGGNYISFEQCNDVGNRFCQRG